MKLFCTKICCCIFFYTSCDKSWNKEVIRWTSSICYKYKFIKLHDSNFKMWFDKTSDKLKCIYLARPVWLDEYLGMRRIILNLTEMWGLILSDDDCTWTVKLCSIFRCNLSFNDHVYCYSYCLWHNVQLLYSLMSFH